MLIPKWAQDLTVNAMIYLESRGYQANLPKLVWRHRQNGTSSSGTCYQRDHITLTVGNDRRDAKLILLHELAHWVLPDEEHHGDNFWRLAFDLFRWAKLPPRVCINRELSTSARRSRRRISRLAEARQEPRKV